MDDQIATDQLLRCHDVPDDRRDDELDVNLGLGDVGIVTVSEDGMQATIALDHEEFVRSHPNTTFHRETSEDGEVRACALFVSVKFINNFNRLPDTFFLFCIR